MCIVALAATQRVSIASEMRSASLLGFVWAADARIAPHGGSVAFTRVHIDVENDDYKSSIWVVDTKTAASRPITFGSHDTSPRWSPDGGQLAFLRRENNNGEDHKGSQIFVLPMNGGEARRITRISSGVQSFAWSPDGKQLVFTSKESPPPTASDLSSIKPKSERKSVIITDPEFKRDGAMGLIDPNEHTHLWVIGIDDALPQPITSGIFDETNPVFAPDGRSVYFASDRRAKPWLGHRDQNIFAVSTDGGPTRKIFDINGPLHSPAVAPNGKTVAALGYDVGVETRSFNQTDLFFLRNGQAVNATEHFDFTLGDDIGSDALPPIGNISTPIQFIGNDRLLTTVSKQGRCALVEFNLRSGERKDVLAGDFQVIAFSANADGSRVAAVIASPSSIGEIYFIENGQPKRLTDLKSQSLANIRLTTPESFWYKSHDNRTVHGWILKPANFDPTRKYPMILEIHGGPHMAYGYGFYQEFHLLAARGYVVVYVNPRGSTSYGQEFGNLIQYNYPGNDHLDLMAAVDEVVSRGYIDESRMGITGGSGGGLLTNWAITRTDRFAAAITQRCVSDWSMFYYTADLTLFTPSWFLSRPFEDPGEYSQRSPINYVKRIKTPLLILHSENDYRTPISQGEALFRAMIALDKPVAMVRIPDSSHNLSRNGKPSLRIERLQHIVDWFDMFLNDRPSDAYGLGIKTAAAKRSGVHSNSARDTE